MVTGYRSGWEQTRTEQHDVTDVRRHLENAIQECRSVVVKAGRRNVDTPLSSLSVIASSRRSTLAFSQDDGAYRLIGQIDVARLRIEPGFDPVAFIFPRADSGSASSSSNGTSGRKWIVPRGNTTNVRVGGLSRGWTSKFRFGSNTDEFWTFLNILKTPNIVDTVTRGKIITRLKQVKGNRRYIFLEPDNNSVILLSTILNEYILNGNS